MKSPWDIWLEDILKDKNHEDYNGAYLLFTQLRAANFIIEVNF